jgi:hypothetical protein
MLKLDMIWKNCLQVIASCSLSTGRSTSSNIIRSTSFGRTWIPGSLASIGLLSRTWPIFRLATKLYNSGEGILYLTSGVFSGPQSRFLYLLWHSQRSYRAGSMMPVICFGYWQYCPEKAWVDVSGLLPEAARVGIMQGLPARRDRIGLDLPTQRHHSYTITIALLSPLEAKATYTLD